VRSHCGGHNKDIVNTLIWIDVIISATICHPIPTTHDLLPGSGCNSASLSIKYPEAYMGVFSQVKLGVSHQEK